jgi:hypothetical protein
MNEQQRAVVQQALETLEEVVKYCWLDMPSWCSDKINERIAALRQLLEQPVQEQLCQHSRTISDGSPENEYCYDCKKAIGLATPPAQPAVPLINASDEERAEFAQWKKDKLAAALEKN